MANWKESLVADFEGKVSEINAMCAEGSVNQLEAKLKELKEIERQYLVAREKEVFGSLSDTLDAIQTLEFDTLYHKKLSEGGVMTGVERCDKNVMIDLQKFCDHKGFDSSWYYDMCALNKRLTLKVNLDIGKRTAAEVEQFDQTYYMKKYVSLKELGKDPTTKTQCVKHLQEVLDSIWDGLGKVTNYDLAFILYQYGKSNRKDNKKLSIVCPKDKTLLELITKVAYHLATGSEYGIEFKTHESRSTHDTKGGPVKVVKKAEKKAEPAA